MCSYGNKTSAPAQVVMQLILKFNETVITVLKKERVIKLISINNFINIILIRVDTMYTCKPEDKIMHKPQWKYMYDKHLHVITHLNNEPFSKFLSQCYVQVVLLPLDTGFDYFLFYF